MPEMPSPQPSSRPDRRRANPTERETTERPLAAISAGEGKALVMKDGQIYLLDVENGPGQDPQLITKEEARALNLHTDPRVIQLNDVGDYPFFEVFELLHEAWLIDRIRVFALSTLDPGLEPAIRAEAAKFVEEYLDDPDIENDIQELLLGPELPADADFANAPSDGKFGALLAAVRTAHTPDAGLLNK